MPIGKFIPVFVASWSEVSSPDLSTIGWSLHNVDADLMVSDFATVRANDPWPLMSLRHTPIRVQIELN